MKPTRKLGLGGFLLASAVAGGISFASLHTANAASSTAVAAVDPASPAPAPAGPHTANGITEAVLAGDQATTVQAAVAAAYPNATIVRMETDADGATYEAHVTMADGSRATVKFDASFNITSTDTHG